MIPEQKIIRLLITGCHHISTLKIRYYNCYVLNVIYDNFIHTTTAPNVLSSFASYLKRFLGSKNFWSLLIGCIR